MFVAIELEMRLGYWIWKNGRRGEDLYSAYLVPCDESLGNFNSLAL